MWIKLALDLLFHLHARRLGDHSAEQRQGEPVVRACPKKIGLKQIIPYQTIKNTLENVVGARKMESL